MKKFIRLRTFDKLANEAAVNFWRGMHLVGINPNSKWRNASDKKILAQIHIHNKSNVGYAYLTFTQPTDCKTGFYNVLRRIMVETYGSCGISTSDLCLVLGVKSLNMSLRRLESAKLIDRNETRKPLKWIVTKFGKDYLDAVEKEFVVG